MAGPLQSILYIHNAIHKEAYEFEDGARELNRDDRGEVGKLLEKFKFFREVLGEHESAEEEFIFPVFEEKFRYLSGAYIFDHRHHDREYDEIEELLKGLGSSQSSSDRADMARKLYRESIIFTATMDLHITKENELLLPVADEHISPEEQGRMLGQAMSKFPPEAMAKILPWMFNHQDLGDKEGFLRECMGMFPPDQFKGMCQLLSGTVPSQDWSEMVRRIPEVA